MSAAQLQMEDAPQSTISVDDQPINLNTMEDAIVSPPSTDGEFSPERKSDLQKENSRKELLQSSSKAENPIAIMLDDGGDARSDGNKCLRQTLRQKRLYVSAAAQLQSFAGEFIGTFILVTAICTAVTLGTIVNALTGLWQVTVLIGIGLGLGIYVSAHISDAHLNPAVTVAFAIVRYKVFRWKKIPVYIAAQMLGGFFAAAVMFGFYHGAVESFEEEFGLERGANGSERTAMIFGEYFPNPAAFGNDNDIVSVPEAFFIEAWGTAFLVFVIFSLTDKRNTTVGSGNNKVVVPILIGLTLAFLISLYGPLTQGGYNPARDFGPRLFAAAAGWGRIAIPGPRNGFWVYIIAPLIGGPIGGALHDFVVANITRLKRFMKPMKNTAN